MLLTTNAKSDAKLQERMQQAARRGVTAKELHQQRVSFIVSAVSDEKTKVTPEQVEQELRKLNGVAG